MRAPWSLWDWTGLRWYIDVHVIDSPAAVDLRRLGALGWVHLQVADTAYVEVMGAKDPDKRDRLRDDLAPYSVAHGPLVLDHSYLGMSVIGTEEDAGRLDAVYTALWPCNDRDADARAESATGRTRFRDALHVATAIRSHGTGFVTDDEKVQRAAGRIADLFDSFRIVSVAAATFESMAAVAHLRKRAAILGQPGPATLPDWP